MNPFGYEKTSGLLDGLSAGTKVLFLGCLSISAMKFGLPPLLALLAAGGMLHAAEGISFRPTATASIYILWLAAFAAILRGILPADGRFFATETLGESGLYALRLLLVFLYARLFYVSTRVADLGNLLTKALRFLRPGKQGGGISTDPGMLLTLSMLFLPRSFDSYARVRDAAAVRGFTPGKLNFGQFSRMMETLVFMGMKNALLAARALETRGYSSLRTIQTPKAKTRDALAACIALAIALASGVPGISVF